MTKKNVVFDSDEELFLFVQKRIDEHSKFFTHLLLTWAMSDENEYALDLHFCTPLVTREEFYAHDGPLSVARIGSMKTLAYFWTDYNTAPGELPAFELLRSMGIEYQRKLRARFPGVKVRRDFAQK